MSFKPLPRMEVIKAVERCYPRRIPLELAKFRGEDPQILHGDALSRYDRFPEGVVMAVIDPIRSEKHDLRPEGGMCIAAENGILPDTPLENIEAFLAEAFIYGELKRSREMNRQ